MDTSRFAFLTHNPWQFINENSKWADEPALTSMSQDVYQLILVVGYGLIALSMVVMFIKWALYKKEDGSMNRRNTITGPLLFKFFMVILISCLPYLIGEVYRIINYIARSMTS